MAVGGNNLRAAEAFAHRDHAGFAGPEFLLDAGNPAMARHDSLLSQDDVRTVWEIQERLTRTPGAPGVFAYDYFEHEQLYGCGAGYNYMFVDAEGNVCPCDFTMISFGNIKERPNF